MENTFKLSSNQIKAIRTILNLDADVQILNPTTMLERIGKIINENAAFLLGGEFCAFKYNNGDITEPSGAWIRAIKVLSEGVLYNKRAVIQFEKYDNEKDFCCIPLDTLEVF